MLLTSVQRELFNSVTLSVHHIQFHVQVSHFSLFPKSQLSIVSSTKLVAGYFNPVLSCKLNGHIIHLCIEQRQHRHSISTWITLIAHQGFWIFNWLTLPLDSEDGFRTCPRTDDNHPDDLFQSRPLYYICIIYNSSHSCQYCLKYFYNYTCLLYLSTQSKVTFFFSYSKYC